MARKAGLRWAIRVTGFTWPLPTSLIRRALPEDMPLVQRLRASHPREEVEHWGYGLWLHVFERAEGDG